MTDHAVGQESELAPVIVNQSGIVLICWEHKAIAGKLLPAIANLQSTAGMPTKWNGSRYDLVLRFDRTSPTVPWIFRQLGLVCFPTTQPRQCLEVRPRADRVFRRQCQNGRALPGEEAV